MRWPWARVTGGGERWIALVDDHDCSAKTTMQIWFGVL
jgi:hypothetical protein